jgi:hypothetical protein
MSNQGLAAILRDARKCALLRMRSEATNTNLILRSGRLAASRRMAARRELAAVPL